MFKKIKSFFQIKTNDTTENIVQANTVLRHRFNNLLRGRKTNQDILNRNFTVVLRKWGITENEIAQVCKDLTARVYLYIFVLLIAVILFLDKSFFLGALLLLCVFFGISTTLWRKFVLKNKHFISYWQYLGFPVLQKKRDKIKDTTPSYKK